MGKHEEFQHSIACVRSAGRALAGDLIWSTDNREEILRVFKVAEDWRTSHSHPMTSMRISLDAKRRKLEVDGITVSRLKRMRSIRKKLERTSLRLNQIQDLAGCRSVVTSISDVETLSRAFCEETRHDFYKVDDYILNPRDSGYRSRHLVFEFNGNDEQEVFNGRRIEIQVRTRLQHSWATAVEVVGTFLGEDLKASEGSSDWLRLFQLVSCEFARTEDCPYLRGMPEGNLVREEIRDIDSRLGATAMLENIRYAYFKTDSLHRDRYHRPKYYLIQYNKEDQTVSVNSFDHSSLGTREYGRAEQMSNEYPDRKIDAVLVEADKIETVKEAFPNYFGDVSVFNKNLKRLTKGDDAIEFKQPPKMAAPPRTVEPPDLSWFYQPRRRKW